MVVGYGISKIFGVPLYIFTMTEVAMAVTNKRYKTEKLQILM